MKRTSLIYIALLTICIAPPIDAHSQRKPVAAWRQWLQSQYFFDGKQQQLFGSTNRAQKCFKLALLADPYCDACHYELSSIYADKRDYHAAANAAGKAYMLDTTNYWYILNYAKLLLVTGNADKSEQLYWKCLAQKPRMDELYSELLELYGMQRNYEKQLALMDYYEQFFGQDANSLSTRQQIHYKQGNLPQSTQYAMLLCDKFPSSQRYALLTAELYMQQNADSIAAIYLGKAAALDSASGEYLMTLSDYYRRTERFAEYFNILQQMFSAAQTPLPTKIFILEFLQQFPQFTNVYVDEIAQLYQMLNIDSIKNYNVDYLFIQFLLQNQMMPLAIRMMYKTMNRALSEPPSSRAERQALHKTNLALYALLGELQWWDSIITATDKYALALDIKYFPYYFKAFALSQKGDYAAAKTAATAALQYLDHADTITSSQAYAMLGDICFNLKEFTNSDKYYEKALKYTPNSPLLLNNYAYYLSLRGKNLKKALNMSAKSLLYEPNNATYLDTYGWILFKQKKYEDAKQTFRKAIMYNGDKEFTILEHYGDVLYELGERDNAIIYWRRALAIDSTNQALARKIEGK
jgi:Tfp pilus assembly protein PilF